MVFRRFLRPAAAGAILFFALGAAPQQRGLVALGALETGQWQLKETGGAIRNLCVTNPAALIQLRHPGVQCTQVVVENSRETATVHYTCPSHGYGRTSITVETSRLVHIDTTGLIDGAPFSDEIEARKIGACR